MALTKEQIIALQSIKGIGLATINKIQKASFINNIYSFRDLYALLKDNLNKNVSLTYEDLLKAKDVASEILDKSEKLGIKVISQYDEKFPNQLLSTVDETGKLAVPNLLYYKGNLNATNNISLAIIGTREPSEEGLFAARHFAKAFASLGVNIVSGLALGCDTAAHCGALDVKGLTTAFLAHGLDSIYPKENSRLADEIIENGGVLMSEYPIGESVDKYKLVARDRLQSGIANATLVIQTSVKGGAMHAAISTLKANKPLFVVEYAKNLGEIVSGNIYLRQEAIGLPYVSAEAIGAEKQRFFDFLLRKGQRSGNKSLEVEQLSLF